MTTHVRRATPNRTPKTSLSDADKKQQAEFARKYPGWTLIRYEDGSVEMIPPRRD